MVFLTRWLVPAVLVLGLTGCIDFADFGDSDRYKEDFHYSYPLAPGGTVSLENANGSVEISGWDQNTVEINGTKYARSKMLLDEVKIDASTSGGAVRIRTVRPVDTHGGSGARYTIHVPRRVLLDTIATTNGSIKVDGVDGNARLQSTNGSIRTQKIHGELNAKTTNGALEAEDLDGNANLHTTNGNIKVDGTHGSLDAITTNGSITASLDHPASNWPLKLHSSNGHIDLTIKTSNIPDVRADTSNSSITVHLPGSVNARVHASTSHSTVTSDFDVLMAGGTKSKSELEGTIGSGGPTLDLSSSNGSIKILKY
jgi:DUF4097 and DUF4098 domain-containing protein YvlB